MSLHQPNMQKCSLTAKLDRGVAAGGPVLKDSAEDASNSTPPPQQSDMHKRQEIWDLPSQGLALP